MSPWRMLTVFVFAPLFGCASTNVAPALAQRVTPGLSNVPWVSGSTAINDQRQPDVVSNGLDACGRYLEHGMLWHQWPPCPVPPPPVVGPELLPTSASPSSAKLVSPWKESFVVEWPCAHLTRGTNSAMVVACTVPEP